MKRLASLLPVLLFSVTAVAASKTYIRDYTYTAGDLDTRYTSRINAIDGVRHDLLQELGVYVQNVVEVHRNSLGERYLADDIVTISAGITSIDLLEERWSRPDFYVKAKIEADPDDVLKTVQAIRDNHELEDSLRESIEELNRSRQQIRELQLALKNNGATATSERQYQQAVQGVEAEASFQRAMAARIRGDFDTAFALFSALAEQGNAKAQTRLGHAWERGAGVAVDYDRARQWYQKAIEHGDADALARMGNLYQKGYGVEQDYKKAAEYYWKAVKANSPTGMARLGSLYELGQGVERNEAEALRLYRLAVQNGSSLGKAKLGCFYENGIIVDEDYAEALSLYTQAAGKGNPFAMARLGNLYLKGRGVEQDLQRAWDLFAEAARQDNGFALAKMGYMYENGLFVERDNQKALELYRQGVHHQNRFAMYRLGRMYEKGKAVDRDLDVAADWYEKAADLGLEAARKRLDKLNR
jgi:TPR repeat protein